MTLRRAKPLPWMPTGCVDSVDGTSRAKDTYPMSLLQNLVPDPSTDRLFVPRPAAVNLTEFGSFNTPTGVSELLVVGDLAYGMISSSHFVGKDEPFLYNLKTGMFIAISGVTAANVPATQATTGDWTPPTMDVIGGKIVVTHPGFGGSATGNYFGWFDISGFTTTTPGNITMGSPTISGFPNISGVTPGMTVTGTNIPANTVVASFANVILAPTGTTHGSTTVDSISSMTGIAVGQQITGAGIADGTTIASVNAGASSITLSAAATASASGVTLNITGTTITMSANATGTATENVIIAGGTAAAPLWAAGNMTGFGLPVVPSWVKNFNNRAYFGVGNQAFFSDVLSPTSAQNAGQALTVGDTTPLTCAEAMPFSSAFGGIQQSLILFKQLGIYQIQGDLATSNLSLQTMSSGTGCVSPRSLATTPEGLGFISNHGLRFITLVGTVSPPVGDHGTGIAVPFINALAPTRIASAYNSDTLRISVQNGSVSGSPWQDWWYDIVRKTWTGPHTFPSVAISPWENTFVVVAQAEQAGLWQSDSYPGQTPSYTENGVQLQWDWQTVLLPDTQAMEMNSIIESSLGFGCYTTGQILNFIALNDNGAVIDQLQIDEASAATIWGAFTWGEELWAGGFLPYQQHLIPWTVPLVANQFTIKVNGFSSSGFKIGNLFLRYQPLGYMIQT